MNHRIGVSAFRRIGVAILRPHAHTPTRPHGRISREAGQAMTEMVFIIPLLVMLSAGVMSVVYMCWQGIKVQQAANLAARIQGQERVSGGVSQQSIADDNGTATTSGDRDLRKLSPQALQTYQQSRQILHPYYSGVYGKIQKTVRALFGANEQAGLSIPSPTYGSVGYSDEVKVQRVITPPDMFGLTFKPIILEGTAYGGEDTHMYGLVRWGSTTNNATSAASKFWTDPNNLPNPNQD